jgi:hypothetical protein
MLSRSSLPMDTVRVRIPAPRVSCGLGGHTGVGSADPLGTARHQNRCGAIVRARSVGAVITTTRDVARP